ncbi:hypothetical protein [Derxia lacustris]|uniref:hypothetical protein n=1 Tax=Derxia lacustris TaxID=764842 RepID=UPI000A17757B|nr:hypothetical protein [Derxia lacustris]
MNGITTREAVRTEVKGQARAGSVARIAMAVALACSAGGAFAADWSDTFIGYTYGPQMRQPGSDEFVTKNIFTLQHVSGYKYGVNFFNVDMLKSDTNNPAKGPTIGQPSKRGAQEVYVVYQNTLSFNSLTNSKSFTAGPIADLGLQLGFDFNSMNDTFGAGLIKLIGGPKVTLAVPGLLQFGLLYYKEYNNNGFSGQNVDFDAALRLSSVWSFNFDAGLPSVIKGWATYTGQKGFNTLPETWFETSYLVDVGTLAGQPKTFYAGVGYQYINHKFGTNTHSTGIPGGKVSSPMFKFEAHF